MTYDKKKDPMGAAIADYLKTDGRTTGRLRVFSPMFEEDEIPLETLYREFEDMPIIEQKALKLAKGRILDVGAGSGCHSLVLQDMDKDVTAIDISPLSVETMQKRGVENALLHDFWNAEELAKEKKFDTVLMLMNGIGIVGSIGKLSRFFHLINNIIDENGQVLLDSTDICYVFENEEGIIELPAGNKYYGELTYQMQYKNIKGESFPWLYIDPETLAQEATKYGFRTEIITQGEHYDYLARLTRA